MAVNSKGIVDAHCNECGPKRKHRVIAVKIIPGSEPYDGDCILEWEDKYEMLQCLGCDRIALRHDHWFSEWDVVDPSTGQVERGVKTTYFPPAVSRRLPIWSTKLDAEISSLMNEVYTALHTDSRCLATMGARAILDKACAKAVGEQNNFKVTLTMMENSGFIGKMDHEFLYAAFDAGSAAAHRGHIATTDQIGMVMDIVENLLQKIYVLHPAAKALKKSTPKRKRK